jgi:hypothetical protein
MAYLIFDPNRVVVPGIGIRGADIAPAAYFYEVEKGAAFNYS